VLPLTVSSLFSFIGTVIHALHAWTKLDDTCMTLRLESDADRHCPAAAIGVEHGTIRTFCM
jgi:hypothetical protein